jgi:hypothetical protein
MKREELLVLLGSGSGLQPINRVIRKITNKEIALIAVLEEANSANSPQGKNAAWTLEVLAREKPKMIEPHLDDIITKLHEIQDFRQLAILLHLLTHYKAGAHRLSPIIDLLIQCLHRKEDAEYIQYYAMQLLEQIVEDEKELSREIALNVNAALPLFEKDYVVNQANRLLTICNKYNN